ncbi:tubulin polyglutamylase complex subunit 2-like [Hydractinia symbiolongicarpus]|uniref:tubulin polyglutamylase complex subunit 2-like n=1 Tax=Hydractinia symbiolongicarpus TaxID=13093 RepID=UPI00254D0B05|nr:tubulin polyglutamylase complex subunit 2-like [Hydractinia symbiolongicarpus]
MSARPEFRDVLDQITFGLVGSLEKKDDVTNVRVVDCGSARKKFIDAWEETNSCKLPADLKAFYLTMNGILIQWSTNLNGHIVQVGSVEINPIESLNLLSEARAVGGDDDVGLKDIDTEDDVFDKEGHRKPHFHEKCFELSSEELYGKVCLVFKDSKSGISGWQYLFTEVGLSPESKYLFTLYLPQRAGDKEDLEPTEVNKIDFDTIFKSKHHDKRKTDVAKTTKNSNTGKLKSGRTGVFKSSFKNTFK